MEKKEYITNQLKRTFNKKYENYCITRIYHLLNSNDIQIITQQLFRRADNHIALADLFFPQINMYVEIDESHHINQKDADILRKKEIEEQKNEINKKLNALGEVISIPLEERRIDVTKDLQEINNQIENLIKEINIKINNLGDKFVPWTGKDKMPEDYIKLREIKISDNVRLKTMQQVSDLFNKGYNGLQHCVFSTSQPNEYVWCPKVKIENNDFKNNKYENEITAGGEYIFESCKNDSDFFKKFDSYGENPYTRIVFAYYKDESERKMYKFKGVYKIDLEKTKNIKKVAWKRIAENIDLSEYFLN